MRPRLEAIYGLIPPEAAAVADIGYDRGRLLWSILDRRPAVRVVGVERQPGAAARVRREYGAALGSGWERVTLVTGDGLRPLGEGQVEGAVIAGIGGPSIGRILRAGREQMGWLSWLVVCPPRFEAEVRPALAELGWRCADERLVVDRGAIYEVILARPGRDDVVDPARLAYGPRLFERPDPLLGTYLQHVKRLFRAALAANLASYGPGSSRAALGRKLGLLGAAIRAEAEGRS